MLVDLSLGFLFCSIDLYFCLCASTIPVEPEVRQVDSSSSILLSQDHFGFLRFFVFGNFFKIFLNIEEKCSIMIQQKYES